MSDTSAFGFGKFVPGFDFLQNLGQAANPGAKGSPQGMPNMASWVAPTLSVEELDKRIRINCFCINPSINSSLKFLRKTPWAREKVEELYIEYSSAHKKSFF